MRLDYSPVICLYSTGEAAIKRINKMLKARNTELHGFVSAIRLYFLILQVWSNICSF